MNTPLTTPNIGPSLVIGGDSMIGQALISHLQRAGEIVWTTSRREKNDDTLFLDLMDPDSFEIPLDVRVAYLSAAVARVEACKRDPAGSRRVNVEAMVSLAERLAKAGTFVVFLSTNQVFDGETSHVHPDAPTSPRTEYGTQKAEAERRIRQVAPRSAIVRFAKVFQPDVVPLFQDWKKTFEAGKTLEPFSDMKIAPIPASCAASVLRLVGDAQKSGIYQVSGDRDFTYDEIARRAAQRWGYDASLVQPVSGAATGRYVEFIPRYTTLDVSMLAARFGIQPPSSEWSIDQALDRA